MRPLVPPAALLSLLLFAAPRENQQQPTPDFLDINPSWSPDGRRLVFESRRTGTANLWIIDADGRNLRQLTPTARGEDTHPAWSPDGRTIVFDSDRDGRWTLRTIHPDGTDDRRLLDPGTDTTGEFARHPNWSPDGRRIVFDRRRDGGDTEVWVVDADGSNQRQITDTRDWKPSSR